MTEKIKSTPACPRTQVYSQKATQQMSNDDKNMKNAVNVVSEIMRGDMAGFINFIDVHVAKPVESTFPEQAKNSRALLATFKVLKALYDEDDKKRFWKSIYRLYVNNRGLFLSFCCFGTLHLDLDKEMSVLDDEAESKSINDGTYLYRSSILKTVYDYRVEWKAM